MACMSIHELAKLCGMINNNYNPKFEPNALLLLKVNCSLLIKFKGKRLT